MAKHVTIGIIMTLFCFHNLVAQPVKAEEAGKFKTIEELVREAHEGANYVPIQELKKRIKENNKLVLLDVRTEREYNATHIKGSAWLERGIAEFVMVRTFPDPNAEIVVYCKQGNRAGLVLKALKKADYKNVAALEGGFDEWTHQGNTIHNFLGEFKMVNPSKINASSFAVEFFQDKN